MSSVGASVVSRPRRRSQIGGAGGLTLGVTMLWLSVIVLLPLAALVTEAFQGGLGAFWDSATTNRRSRRCASPS